MTSSATQSGPLAWRNWKAQQAGRDQNGAFEYPLYTDALVTNEVRTGPYEWINTVAGSARPIVGNASVAIVLRADIYLTDDEQVRGQIDWDKPDTKDYLGGDIGDEVAALGSLALARRLASGGLTRRFAPGDERGVPFEAWHQAPRLTPPLPGHRSMLPLIEEGVDLADAVPLLEAYPGLSVNNARALARAARLYALALWVADDDPAQAWLRLVAALEAAASQWKSSAGASDIEKLQAGDPELAELVAQAPEELSAKLTAHLAPTVKATAKFVDFTLTHLPDPPAKRPAFGVVEWDDMESTLRTIYKHRSRDLHAGTPFPGPLCGVPMRDEDGVATEKIHSLGVAGQGGVWTEEELPMQLHTFAHIAGGALRNWWAEMGGLSASAPAEAAVAEAASGGNGKA
jgi:hypothetical protein